MEYVVCVAFDGPQDFVALIRKSRPEWQAGRLNGPGGKVKAGETPQEAAAREFHEEVGPLIPPHKWRHYATLRCPDATCDDGAVVHFLTVTRNFAITPGLTDEHVDFYHMAGIRGGDLPVIPNLLWLIPAALDKDQVFVDAREPSRT